MRKFKLVLSTLFLVLCFAFNTNAQTQKTPKGDQMQNVKTKIQKMAAKIDAAKKKIELYKAEGKISAEEIAAKEARIG